MAPRVTTWKRRAAKALSDLLDRVERLPGRRFYDLHLEAAALRHRQGRNTVNIKAKDQRIKFRTPTARALWRAETLLTKEPATIGWIDSFDRDDIFVNRLPNLTLDRHPILTPLSDGLGR